MEIRSKILSGQMVDAQTGKALQGVKVYEHKNARQSTFSNKKGEFEIKIKINRGLGSLVFRLPGYQTIHQTIDDQSENPLRVSMHAVTNGQDLDDFQLITKALTGDQLSYTTLLGRYRDSVYFIILKMINNTDDADDLTIEAFGKAFNNLEKYSPDYAFSTWLFRIAINNTIDFIRKKKLDTFSIDEPIHDNEGSFMSRNILAKGLDPEERFIKQQRAFLIRKVTNQLNTKYRTLIELRFFKELSYNEIAEEMGLPIGTVKAQLFRAKELLHNILKHSRERY